MWILYIGLGIVGIIVLTLIITGLKLLIVYILDFFEDNVWIIYTVGGIVCVGALTGLYFLLKNIVIPFFKQHMWIVYITVGIIGAGVVIGGVFLVRYLIDWIYERSTRTKSISTECENENTETNSYENNRQELRYKRKYLLTKNEYKFYQDLKLIANKHNMIVLAKIRMADLVAPCEEGWRYRKAFEYIKAKHVDFALCSPDNMYVKLLIELDDRSHERDDRKLRDRFVEKVYNEAGYKLLRVENSENIEDKIIQELTSISCTHEL